ncbi:outer membrane lipoprotein [Izhakiella capsodis]|uniref:Outer membrane lipoprotein n=1 Tax=Izhakiella capsodis TaxID=1367852 RepID=A0A1I4ZB73_9GAMM|nr:Slp family lipoprotein [Izhakiella capsodis]SFN47219.1 outer membrane lipoprotein [Izhakiella capsodis]
MRKSALLTFSFFASILLLTGCVSIPDSIKGTSPTPQEDLIRVMNAPQLYVGQESRFGGKVVKVINENGYTLLEIAASQLDDSGRPILGAASTGRLFARIKGFVDPIDFNNHWVTVVGPITGTREGKIGGAKYNFITVDATGYQRWRIAQQIVSPPMPVDPWIWYGPDRFHHRGYWGPPPFGWYNPGPARVETFLTE